MTELPVDVRTLLEGANNAHLATLMPDGSPHSVPLWIGIDDDRIVFLTGPQSRKAKNLALDPRVAASVTEQGNPFVAAVIRGRVSERIEGDAAWEIIDRLSHKYINQPYPRGEDRVVFVIEPESAFAQRFG